MQIVVGQRIASVAFTSVNDPHQRLDLTCRTPSFLCGICHRCGEVGQMLPVAFERYARPVQCSEQEGGFSNIKRRARCAPDGGKGILRCTAQPYAINFLNLPGHYLRL